MPADTRNIKRNRAGNYNSIYGRDRIGTSGYSNNRYSPNMSNRTNTAYDLTDYRTLPTVQPQKRETVKSVPKHKTDTVINKKNMRKVTTMSIVVFVAAMIILCRYVGILNGNRRISELEKQYGEIVSQNQAMQVKIDGKLEKGEIEKIAKEELGMMVPESYQVFYIQMDMQDGGDGQTNDKPSEAVLGTPGTLMNAFRVLK